MENIQEPERNVTTFEEIQESQRTIAKAMQEFVYGPKQAKICVHGEHAIVFYDGDVCPMCVLICKEGPLA